MNITMNIDCTPEEARRLMGLPDMGPVHELYLGKLKQAMTEGVTPDMIDQMVRTWAPMGEAGLGAWRALVDQMSRSSTER